MFVAPGNLDLDRIAGAGELPAQWRHGIDYDWRLVAEWSGHVPQVGEAVEHGGIRVEVLAGNERCVEQVRISRVEAPVESKI